MKAISLRRLDDEQAKDWLNRQAEFYTHNKNQAYRLIQLVIGVGSILTILLTNSASLINSLIKSGQNSLLSGNVPTQVETVTVQSGYLIAVCVLFLSAIYILDSIQWSFDVLQTPKPQPGLGSDSNSSEIRIEVGEFESPDVNQNQTMYHDQLSTWLNGNKEMLNQMDDKLNKSYKHLAVGSGLLLTGGVFLYSSYSGNTGSLTFTMAGVAYVLHGGVKALIKAIWMFSKECWDNRNNESIRAQVSNFITSATESDEMKGSKSGIALLIQPLIYVQSLTTVLAVILWLFIPNSFY